MTAASSSWNHLPVKLLFSFIPLSAFPHPRSVRCRQMCTWPAFVIAIIIIITANLNSPLASVLCPVLFCSPTMCCVKFSAPAYSQI
ncbi:hypothetical protein T06_1550 [Trichinella sp. T6]|nr:hypothetical protein T06_1550 [Trichinella sp. T6]